MKPVITIVVQNGFADIRSKPRGVRVKIIDRDTGGDPEEIISVFDSYTLVRGFKVFDRQGRTG